MDIFDNNSNNSNQGYNPSFGPTTNDTFYEHQDDSPFVGAVPATDENTLLSRVFRWMALGLGISAVTAFLGSYLIYYLIGTGHAEIIFPLMIGLAIVEVILVIVFSLRINKMSSTAATICFLTYALLNGATLSTILLYYTTGSVFSTFIAAGAMFGAAALYGKVTKKSLASWGSYLIMGLFGIIVAGIINIFLGNTLMNMLIAVIGIVIFVGLTAYDVNRIRDYARQEGLTDTNRVKKVVIWGALQLYLDFINIFLKLLQLMGKRK